MKSLKIIVTGRVQGVFFRASAKQMVDHMQVLGYAKNLPNGEVEVLAQGDDSAVDTLVRWLHHGPDMAHVTHVSILATDLRSDLTDFKTL